MLPSVASINGIQVKEYIQSLTDENKLRVEKIGSGNWYWSFASDEARVREGELVRVKREVGKVEAGIREAEARLAVLREGREREREREREEGKEGENEREKLLGVKKGLEREVKELRGRIEGMRMRGEGKGVGEMKAEVGELKDQAGMWTDNVYILEEYLRKLAGGDREVVQGIQRECYGEEYVEGEGLRELA